MFRSFGSAMKLMSRFAAAICLLALSVAGPHAAEAIKRFTTLVEVAVDGSLTITETIRVNAEGNQIKRGIYRDIPVLFEDREGKQQKVDLEVLSIQRDGNAEPYFTESGSNFLRIYIGDKDVFLPAREYVYVIKYWTDRQIRIFDTHDEIYWNATGNGWDFPINEARAIVVLPPGAVAQDTVFFTGPLGSRDKNARVQLEDGGNRAVFDLTTQLGPREGLTVAVSMKKGVIAAPSEAQKSRWWWREHGAAVVALATLVIVLLYYLWAWNRVGRDPPKGAIVPRWDAPDGISPALTAYIEKKGFSGKGWDALSGALINLAVKGYVILDNETDDLIIQPTGKAVDRDLPVGEAALLNRIAGGGDFYVTKSNSSAVATLQRAFTGAIEREHRSEFYKANIGWIIGGAALSLIGLLSMLGFAELDDETIGILFVVLVPGVIFTFVSVSIARSFASSRGLIGKIKNVLFIGILGAVALPNLLVHASSFVFEPRDPILLATIASILMVNLLFFFLIGAPTPIGQKMMDGIEGLKTYLQLAEADRMNLAGVPTMSPRHFETLLPYAVALGVEKPWSNAFDNWLAAATATEASGYSPHWQRGMHSRGQSLGNSFGAIGPSMGDSFTASMPVPKSSSSGFSGGSSGGGGGGGGGGGW